MTQAVDTATLFNIGQVIKDKALQCFASQGIVPPERQLVYMSPIPADCPQLAVLFSGWQQVPALADELITCDMHRWAANFTVAIARNSPALPARSGKPPSVASMEAAAAVASADAEVLICLAASFDEVGGLDLRIAAPQGGIQIVEIDLLVPATGF